MTAPEELEKEETRQKTWMIRRTAEVAKKEIDKLR